MAPEEKFTAIIGSWGFVSAQTFFLLVYLLLNTGLLIWAHLRPIDPFPFVFLNLMLSFQAAYTGPIVLMGQIAAAKRDEAHKERDRKQIAALLLVVERMDKRDEADSYRDIIIQHLLESNREMLRNQEYLLRAIGADVEELLEREG